MQHDDTDRLVEEEAPDGTLVIYDPRNFDAWIQSVDAIDLGRQV